MISRSPRHAARFFSITPSHFAELKRVKNVLALVAGFAATSLAVAAVAVAPTTPSAKDFMAAYVSAHAQRLTVSNKVTTTPVARAPYSATPGTKTLAASGTNYDWAKLVLISGGWPVTDTNVTVLVRWMRQENGPNDWWNRNNPLNNGYGSGGGGGSGTYTNLIVAAQMAAANLHRHPGFAPIASALSTSAPTSVIEQAIWASPWATGHYANGGHWHYTAVPVVKAPAGAW